MKWRVLALALLVLGARAFAADVSGNPQPVIDWANGSVLSSTVTVATSATNLPATALTARRRILIYNNDNSATMYVGACSGTTVTTANGFPIPRGGVFVSELGPSAVICGIVASGTVNARVLEAK